SDEVAAMSAIVHSGRLLIGCLHYCPWGRTSPAQRPNHAETLGFSAKLPIGYIDPRGAAPYLRCG
ncbi:MAG: hypothetical protein OXT01_09625, partial [Rhodospirillaceae bacterium]|nr:hypothetical protein [Rhodospirillaceae bacterium]